MSKKKSCRKIRRGDAFSNEFYAEKNKPGSHAVQKRVDRTKKGVENVSPTTPGMKKLMTIRNVVKHGNNTLTLTLLYDLSCLLSMLTF